MIKRHTTDSKKNSSFFLFFSSFSKKISFMNKTLICAFVPPFFVSLVYMPASSYVWTGKTELSAPVLVSYITCRHKDWLSVNRILGDPLGMLDLYWFEECGQLWGRSLRKEDWDWGRPGEGKWSWALIELPLSPQSARAHCTFFLHPGLLYWI